MCGFLRGCGLYQPLPTVRFAGESPPAGPAPTRFDPGSPSPRPAPRRSEPREGPGSSVPGYRSIPAAAGRAAPNRRNGGGSEARAPDRARNPERRSSGHRLRTPRDPTASRRPAGRGPEATRGTGGAGAARRGPRHAPAPTRRLPPEAPAAPRRSGGATRRSEDRREGGRSRWAGRPAFHWPVFHWPVFHWTERRVRARLAVCYPAFVLLRLHRHRYRPAPPGHPVTSDERPLEEPGEGQSAPVHGPGSNRDFDFALAGPVTAAQRRLYAAAGSKPPGRTLPAPRFRRRSGPRPTTPRPRGVVCSWRSIPFHINDLRNQVSKS